MVPSSLYPRPGSTTPSSPPAAAAMPGGVWVLALSLLLLAPGEGRPGRALGDESAGAPLGSLGEGS